MAIDACKELNHPPHLEIETYTWDVLPDSALQQMGRNDLTASVIAEYEALISVEDLQRRPKNGILDDLQEFFFGPTPEQ